MSDDGTYRTIDGRGVASVTARGSRFEGAIAPVDSVSAAESFIARMEATHPDATHIVPAFRIRADPLREWSSDAGEPGGSAGKPILTALAGEDLEDVVAVVARYFGGTELGIGGLIRAYREVVVRAIADTDLVARRPRTRFRVETSYDDSGTVRSILEGSAAEIEATYAEVVTFTVTVPIERVDALRDRLLSATSGRVALDDR